MWLSPETVRQILTDEVVEGLVSEAAAPLGLRTIMAAREVIVFVRGAAKRAPLAGLLAGTVTPSVPASILKTHPRCLVLADRDALG